MAQEKKDLLLKDLCARLPYKIKCENFNHVYGKNVFEVTDIRRDGYICGVINNKHCYAVFDPLELKPYLFPLSSVTAEQLYELRELFGFEIEFLNGFIDLSSRSTLEYLEMIAIIEWFNKNHFDINGLIPMGLAKDATNLNIY